jgi:hypothetical protein
MYGLIGCLMFILLFFNNYGLCSIHSLGKIDENFSYENLAYDRGYLSGTMLNKSSSIQKDIRIKFEAYDVLDKMIWDVIVRIDFIKAGGSFNFKQIISYQNIETPLKLKAINLNAKRNVNKDSNPEDATVDDYSYQSSKRLPILFSGNGNKMSELFHLEKGILKVTFDHKGKGLGTVYLKDRNGKNLEMIINEIGNFRGSKGFNVPYTGKYFLNVEADQNTNWSLLIEKPTEFSVSGSQEEGISIKRGKDGVIYLEQK